MEPSLKPELRAQVVALLREEKKIEAIKIYRDGVAGCGLKEAKEAVEEIARKEGIALQSGGCSLGVLFALLCAVGVVIGILLLLRKT